MRIPKIFTAAALGSALMTGCGKNPNFTKISKSTPVSKMADSLHNATKGVLKDTSVKCFEFDTLILADSAVQVNPAKLMGVLSKQAEKVTPETTIVAKVGPDARTEALGIKKYVDVKPVIEDGVFQSKYLNYPEPAIAVSYCGKQRDPKQYSQFNSLF